MEQFEVPFSNSLHLEEKIHCLGIQNCNADFCLADFLFTGSYNLLSGLKKVENIQLSIKYLVKMSISHCCTF